MKESVAQGDPPPFGRVGKADVGLTHAAESPEAASAIAEAWMLYGRGDYATALQSVKVALQRFPEAFDLRYAEGLCLKRLGRGQEAAGAFHEALRETDRLGDKVKVAMLTRLLTGHIHLLEQGAWNLEPETWTRA